MYVQSMDPDNPWIGQLLAYALFQVSFVDTVMTRETKSGVPVTNPGGALGAIASAFVNCS